MLTAVTGASGFLGSHIADALFERGDQVRLVDLHPSRWRHPDQQMVIADVTRQDDMATALAGVDVVYHCAAVADLDQAASNNSRTIEVNTLGAVTAFNAAKECGASRFILASSMYALGTRGGMYGASKAAAEALLGSMSNAMDLPLTILRYGSLYGPRADSGNAIRRLAAAICDGRGRVDFWGDGTEVREYIHVRDAAQLSLRAVELSDAVGVFHISGRERITTRHLLEMLAEIGGRVLEVSYQDRPFAGRYRLTPHTINWHLGAHITAETYIDLASGLAECLMEAALEAELTPMSDPMALDDEAGVR